MTTLFRIDEIVDSPSKVGILRVLASGKGFKATGSEIARQAGFSVPATHESLKELHAHNVLTLEIMGKQHIYALNEEDRIVQKMIRPMFQVEAGYKGEIRSFIKEQMLCAGILKGITSVILYGSSQNGKAVLGSDVDIAVIVTKAGDVQRVSDAFISVIGMRFKSYFGVQLDTYIKSAAEFKERLKNNQPPVKNLMKSYAVLYGKEPLEV